MVISPVMKAKHKKEWRFEWRYKPNGMWRPLDTVDRFSNDKLYLFPSPLKSFCVTRILVGYAGINDSTADHSCPICFGRLQDIFIIVFYLVLYQIMCLLYMIF